MSAGNGNLPAGSGAGNASAIANANASGVANSTSGKTGGALRGGVRKQRPFLSDFVDVKVCIITNDGRNVIGIMRGFDQVCNIVLENTFERVFSTHSGVRILPLGLYVVRGDNIAIVGEIDVELDDNCKWETVKVLIHLCSLLTLLLLLYLHVHTCY